MTNEECIKELNKTAKELVSDGEISYLKFAESLNKGELVFVSYMKFANTLQISKREVLVLVGGVKSLLKHRILQGYHNMITLLNFEIEKLESLK